MSYRSQSQSEENEEPKPEPPRWKRGSRSSPKVAAGIAVLILAAASGTIIRGPFGSNESSGAVTSNEAQIKRQLLDRLHDHSLSPHWVACLPNGRRFEGAAVIRCNVNYGDPHVEAICSVLRDGELVTDHDEAGIPCGPDRRGKPPYIETFD